MRLELLVVLLLPVALARPQYDGYSDAVGYAEVGQQADPETEGVASQVDVHRVETKSSEKTHKVSGEANARKAQELVDGGNDPSDLSEDAQRGKIDEDKAAEVADESEPSAPVAESAREPATKWLHVVSPPAPPSKDELLRVSTLPYSASVESADDQSIEGSGSTTEAYATSGEVAGGAGGASDAGSTPVGGQAEVTTPVSVENATAISEGSGETEASTSGDAYAAEVAETSTEGAEAGTAATPAATPLAEPPTASGSETSSAVPSAEVQIEGSGETTTTATTESDSGVEGSGAGATTTWHYVTGPEDEAYLESLTTTVKGEEKKKEEKEEKEEGKKEEEEKKKEEEQKDERKTASEDSTTSQPQEATQESGSSAPEKESAKEELKSKPEDAYHALNMEANIVPSDKSAEYSAPTASEENEVAELNRNASRAAYAETPRVDAQASGESENSVKTDDGPPKTADDGYGAAPPGRPPAEEVGKGGQSVGKKAEEEQEEKKEEEEKEQKGDKKEKKGDKKEEQKGDKKEEQKEEKEEKKEEEKGSQDELSESKEETQEMEKKSDEVMAESEGTTRATVEINEVDGETEKGAQSTKGAAGDSYADTVTESPNAQEAEETTTTVSDAATITTSQEETSTPENGSGVSAENSPESTTVSTSSGDSDAEVVTGSSTTATTVATESEGTDSTTAAAGIASESTTVAPEATSDTYAASVTEASHEATAPSASDASKGTTTAASEPATVAGAEGTEQAESTTVALGATVAASGAEATTEAYKTANSEDEKSESTQKESRRGEAPVIVPSGYDVHAGANGPLQPDMKPVDPAAAVGYPGIPDAKPERLSDAVGTDDRLQLAEDKVVEAVEVATRAPHKWHPYRFDCAEETDEKGPLCKDWAEGGLCEHHRPTMFLFCRKTCLCTGWQGDN